MTAATATHRSHAGLAVGGLVAGGAAVGFVGAQRPLLTLAALLLAGLAAAIFLWPEAATLLVVFLVWANIPAVAVTYHGAPLMLGAMVPFLLVVPLVVNSLRGEKLRVQQPFAFLAFYLVVLIVAALMSRYQSIGLDKVLTFAVEGFVVYLLVTNAIRSPDTLRHCVWAMLAAGALLASITVFQKLTGTWSRPYGGFGTVHASYFIFADVQPRASGPLSDPNYYAQILLTLVPLGLISIWRDPVRAVRLLSAGATLLICAAIMITNSRGAALGFAVVLILLAALGYFRLYQGLAVVLGVILLLSFVPEYRDRVASLSTVTAATTEEGSEGGEESTRSRATEAGAAMLVFVDHPVLGVGPGAFPQYYQRYAERIGLQIHDTVRTGAKKGQEARRQSHNLFLSIAADLGLVGLLAFGGFIFATLRALAQARRRCLAKCPDAADLAAGFLVAIAAYITAGMFLTLSFERYFWLLMGLAGAAAALNMREQRT